MDAEVTSDDLTINSSKHKETYKSADNTDNGCKYLDTIECSKVSKNIDGDCGIEGNSEIKCENTSVFILQKTNSFEEALCSGKDKKLLPLPFIHTCAKEANHKENNSSAKTSDPFDLSTDEELSQEKYQPIKRKLLQTSDKFEETLCNGCDKNLSQFSCICTCDKQANKSENDQSSAKMTDPFDLTAEEELSQERYQPIKRKLCHENQNSNLDRDPAQHSGAASNIFGTIQQEEAMTDVQQNVSESKKWKASHHVVYVHSQELLEKTNELIRIEGRAELVHSLVKTFGLLQYLEVISPRLATDVEILGFHCPDYITFLHNVSKSDDTDDSYDPACKDAESYGLSYDCPLQKGIYETCCLISGATIVAAERLINSTADVAINWYGGWHHAKRDSASGFCYINDIVLGILKLREKFDRILYVDIDLHHGDGVEEAFCMTPKVMTVSFHKYMSGFFPGSGSVDDIGTGKGKFYSVNVPLLDGIKDAEFFDVFYRIMKLVREKFKPQVIVMQCGADILAMDPMASFNLTHLGIAKCVGFMLSWNLPTLLLGGGGYNFPNTARCWTFLTSLAAGKKLPLDIPEHEHLMAYSPDFEMNTTAGNRKDCNTKEYLANLVAKISRYLSDI